MSVPELEDASPPMAGEESPDASSVRSRLTPLVRLDIQAPGTDLSASMMLSEDDGEGHIMLATSDGPVFSMSTARLPEMIQVLVEAEAARKALRPLPDGVGAADVKAPED